MEEVLDILSQVPGVQGVLIIGRDGLVISKNLRNDLDADYLGAALAEFFTSADVITNEKSRLGLVDIISLEAEQGKYFLISINELTFLAVLTQSRVNLGLIRSEMKASLEKLKEVL